MINRISQIVHGRSFLMDSPGILEKKTSASCHVTSVEDKVSLEVTPLETVVVKLSFGRSEILGLFFFLAFRFFFLFSILCG